MAKALEPESPGGLTVPLFPLPDVVLFPRAVLPLHIFEDRYKLMTAAALAAERRIAVALLKPGWEKDYYSTPPIEPVVCVGRILASEQLVDGKFNLLLQGEMRATIVREDCAQPFRSAQVQPIRAPAVMEIDLVNQRQRLTEMFRTGPLSTTLTGSQLRKMLSGPLSTSDIADLIAFNVLEDAPLKQSLLAELDVQRRVERLLSALEMALPAMQTAYRRFGEDIHMN
jgi:Lon protease-like protein